MFLASGLRRSELSDAELLSAAGEGAAQAMRALEERHGAAVRAYARTCVVSADDAAELTAYAFTGLRLRAARTPPDAVGCVRVALFDSVRSTAVLWARPEQPVLTRSFGTWVGSGAVWSLDEDGELLAAFRGLTAQQQCVLWHASVERDPSELIARVTGLPESEVWREAVDTGRMFRRRCAELYAQRVEQTACLRFVNSVLLGPGESWNGPYDTGHLRLCADCRELFRELRGLQARLPVHLPRRLLGWWPAGAYHTAKDASPRPRAGGARPAPAGAGQRRVPGPRAAHGRRTRRGRRPRGRAVPAGLLAAAALVLLVSLAAGLWP
ncbi:MULTISPECIES: RNA polymerase sigma factor [Streptomyces]|uniref:RNA polymerase sigma factor n=1 Tax=Streptomyces TaxID=1883 RepID=UPI00073DE2CF|nr:hypothetical protein [Streptomyces sp. EAS-AB2608]MYU31300.1 hypothetical protein [Streptomyces sp. SID7810]BCM70719.1 hypothetical protein EASAB2608_06053 [Streptomyces sp. EAS-AB2608]CUW32410.1 hypothetical protein TUE45_07159 [Streptomyces reticuli]